MAAPVWVNSNWITFPTGSSSRLTALRLHIQEMDDFLRGALYQYSIEGREVDPHLGELQRELQSLRDKEVLEAELVDVQTGARQGWTSGKARL